MSKKVVVDQEACISCGLCVSILPEVFRFEEGKSVAYDPEGASEGKIQECVEGCPVGAISWQEG